MRAGRDAELTVATFTDGDPNARARDYDVTIKWGDDGKVTSQAVVTR